MSRPPVVVIGAGLAGLTAARELRRRGIAVRVFEATDSIAGLAASESDDGFVSDTGAHFITNRLAAAVGISAECRSAARYSETVLLGESRYRYPMGLLRVPRFVASAVRERIRPTAMGQPLDVGERFRSDYGSALADEVAIPLVEAWSGLPAEHIAAAAADKIPSGLAHTLRLRAVARIAKRAVAIGYCASAPEIAGVHHVYPTRGGVATICDALARPVRDAIELEMPVESICVVDGRVVGVRVGGAEHDASAVVSTAPVPVLAGLVADTTDALVPFAAFAFRSMVIVELRMRGRDLLPDVVNWIPDRDCPFFRLTEVSQSLPWLAPEGRTAVLADIGCMVGDATWSARDDDLARLCTDHLARWVPGAAQRLIGLKVTRVKLAYPVFSLDYESDRVRFAAGTGIAGLESIGRNGEFAHLLMEDVYWRTTRRMHRLADEVSASR